MKLGARNFGIHSFLASNTVSNEYYPTLAGILFELAVELKEKQAPTYLLLICLAGSASPIHRTKNRMISMSSEKAYV